MNVELTKDYYFLTEIAELAGIKRCSLSYFVTKGKYPTIAGGYEKFPEMDFKKSFYSYYSKAKVAKFLESYRPGHRQIERKKVLARKKLEKDESNG